MALLAALATLAGCGGSSPSSGNGIAAKSAEQIVAAAKSAADTAASVHIAGSVVSSGKPLAIDLRLLAGKGGKGTITIEGLRIDLVRVAGAVYINGSEALYRHLAGPAAAQLLKGKWLKAPEKSGNFAPLAALTDLAGLIDTTLANHGTLVREGTSTVEGRRAVGVRDSSQGAVLYVAAAGSPFPLEISKGGGGGGRIVFSEWDQPVTIEAPANAININQLQSGH